MDFMTNPRSHTTHPDQSSGTLPLLGRLWRDYLSRYMPQLIMALGAMAILAVTLAAMPFAVEAINAAFIGGQAGGATRGAAFRPSLEQVITFGPAMLAGLGLAYAIAQYTQSRLSIGAALNALRDIQNDMFVHYLALDFARQREELSGALASRFTNDIQVMRETLTRITNGARDLLQLIALCGTLIYYDIVLFLMVIVVYGVVGWPIAWLGKKLRRTARDAQAETGNLAASITEVSDGAAMIKVYNLVDREQRRAIEKFSTRTDILKKAAFLRAINEPFIFFVGAIAMGVVVAIMGARIASGAIDAPEIAGFLVALLLLSAPARGLSTLYAVLQEGLAAFSRILTLIDAMPEITDSAQATAKNLSDANIDIENISFAYHDTPAVLEDISLSIPAGTSLALVGESGAGKTTLTNLLPRLYDGTHGIIRINGYDIRDIKLTSLREQIAVVSQDAVIFNESLRDNIAFGNLAARDEDIISAAKSAAIHDFIESLPQGYNTIAGEKGNRLSGGQRQRIAIARAFLKNAPILILDEPTSALDAESEAAIQDALAKLQVGRTTIIIAHRLSTIRNADNIAVLERGRIIEQGSHETLMQQSGPYNHLVALQFGTH